MNPTWENFSSIINDIHQLALRSRAKSAEGKPIEAADYAYFMGKLESAYGVIQDLQKASAKEELNQPFSVFSTAPSYGPWCVGCTDISLCFPEKESTTATFDAGTNTNSMPEQFPLNSSFSLARDASVILNLFSAILNAKMKSGEAPVTASEASSQPVADEAPVAESVAPVAPVAE